MKILTISIYKKLDPLNILSSKTNLTQKLRTRK
jgi:hypothetical protein